MNVTYTAKRKLKLGVTAGDIITIDIPVKDLNPNPVQNIPTTTSLDGTIESNVNYIKESWKVVTEFGNGLLKEDYEQFLYSVLGNAPFSFEDPDNNDQVNIVVMTGTFKATRVVREILEEFNYSFTMREQ